MTDTLLVDAHVHVFTRDMPLVANPRHAPTYSFTVEQLIATMDAHGVAFGVIAASISAFISNTTTAAMLLPIGLGMMGALGGMVSDQSDTDRDVSRLRFGTALMLMISYAAGVGGLLTPIGSPPNLIGIAFIEQATDVSTAAGRVASR